jgi:hypothetical protein
MTHRPSRNAYANGCRCAGCREENRLYHAAQRRDRAVVPVPEHVHGRNGYSNYGCRCAVCKAAQAVKNAKNYVARKASA